MSFRLVISRLMLAASLLVASQLVFAPHWVEDYYRASAENASRALGQAFALWSPALVERAIFVRHREAEAISLVPPCCVELYGAERISLETFEALPGRIQDFFGNVKTRMGEEDFYSDAQNPEGGYPVATRTIEDWCVENGVETELCSRVVNVIQWAQSEVEYPVLFTLSLCDFSLNVFAQSLKSDDSSNSERIESVLSHWTEIRELCRSEFIARNGEEKISAFEEKVSQTLSSFFR